MLLGLCVLCDAVQNKKKAKKKSKKIKPQADAPLPIRQNEEYDENYDQTYYDEKDDEYNTAEFENTPDSEQRF